MRKVSRYAKKQSKFKVVEKKTVDVMTYVECYLATYFESCPWKMLLTQSNFYQVKMQNRA